MLIFWDPMDDLSHMIYTTQLPRWFHAYFYFFLGYIDMHLYQVSDLPQLL